MTLEEAIARALEDCQLSADYAGVVRELLDQPAETWPRCCGSDCDPCVNNLARTVLRVRRLMRTGA